MNQSIHPRRIRIRINLHPYSHTIHGTQLQLLRLLGWWVIGHRSSVIGHREEWPTVLYLVQGKEVRATEGNLFRDFAH
jgi:hypothetical protein